MFIFSVGIYMGVELLSLRVKQWHCKKFPREVLKVSQGGDTLLSIREYTCSTMKMFLIIPSLAPKPTQISLLKMQITASSELKWGAGMWSLGVYCFNNHHPSGSYIHLS